MAKRMLSLLLAAVMVLGMVPAMNLTVSAEESAQTSLTPLWSEDFESETTDASYSNAKFAVNNNNANSPHHYNLDIAEENGDKYLHITYNQEAFEQSYDETGLKYKHGFYARSTGFTKTTDAMVLNFSVKFSNEMNTFMIRVLAADGSGLISLLFASGTITYSYSGSNPWSGAMTDITTKSVSIAKDQWHDLQLIAFQRSGEGQQDYWALMENGEILIQYEGDHHFGNKAENTKSFGAVDFYVQTATSGEGTVQINNTYFNDFAAYEYIGANSVAFAKSEYTVQPGGKVQTAVVVTPTLTMPAVKPVYTSGNIGVATVDANGLVTAVAAGTATITATLTNPDGSVKTAETTVKVEGAKILWDSDFDSESLTPADANFNMSNNVSNGKWANGNTARNTNGGYSVKIAADAQNSSDHYLSIQPGAATDAVVSTYNYLSSTFTATSAIDVRFNLQLHENENGVRDSVSFRLHPVDATQAGLMDVVFTSDGTVWAANSTLNTNGYKISKEDAAAGLDVRIVAVQNEGTDSDLYRVYINGTLALTGTTFGASTSAPHVNYNFQMITIKNSTAAAGVYTNTDTRIDDLVVCEYTPVAATGITLDRESADLKVGKTLQLTATVQPAGADVAKITYASDAAGVATVSETGLVTAVAAGTATITATVTNLDGTTKTDSVTVTVPETDPNLLWSEDFESETTGSAYSGENFTINNDMSNNPHHYNLDIAEDAGDKYLQISYNQAAYDKSFAETGSIYKYGLYARSTAFSKSADAVVLNFSTRFSSAMNVFQIRLMAADASGLLTLMLSSGKVTYSYSGSNPWSGDMTDVTTKSVSLSSGEWHDLQLVAIQRSGENSKDYWALLEDGKILIEHEGDHHFGNDVKNTKSFGVVDFRVQSATSGNVQINDMRLDDIAVYEYIPASGVALDKDSYALKSGETAQAAAAVTPELTIPGVNVEYSVENTAVATVDANGLITGKAGGTTTLTAKVTNFDGTVVTDTATVAVEHVETVLWDSDFDSETVTAEGQYFNYDTYPNAKEWRPNADRFTNGDYNVKIVADADDPTNHYLQIKAGAETTATTQFFRYRTQSFAATAAIEISFKLWLNKDANGRWDSFTIQIHPSPVTDANILAIAFGSDGCVTYPVAGGTAKTAQLKANQWQNVRLVVMQNADDAFDAYKLYVDDVLMAQWMGCQYTSNYNTGNPHAFQLITSAGSNGLYTCVDTRIDDLMVRSYTPVEATGVTLKEEAVTVGNQPVQLHATVAPANVDVYEITYASAAPAVATVSETGLVTGVAEGQTTVTVTVTTSTGDTFTDTVAVTVDGDDLNLLWSDDFDGSQITAADGQYTNSDKWSVTSNGSYNLRVVQDPADAENKVLHLTNNAPAATTNAFSYASTAFAGREIVEFSFDAWIGYDAESKNADWFQFSVGAAANQPLVNLIIWSSGTISYATTSSTVWSDAASTTVTYNTWHTFRVVVMQREGTENDMWQLWMDDQLIFQQTSFIPSSLVDNLPCYVKINTSNSSSGNYTVRNTYLDNMQVNVFTPVAATAIEAPETMEVEIGRISQLTVTATPAEASL